MTFYRGQRVVYFRRSLTLSEWWTCLWHRPPGERLVLGQVYQISNVTEYDTLELFGIYSPADDWWAAGFKMECFRPVCDRKTDISELTEMLKSSKRGVPA